VFLADVEHCVRALASLSAARRQEHPARGRAFLIASVPRRRARRAVSPSPPGNTLLRRDVTGLPGGGLEQPVPIWLQQCTKRNLWFHFVQTRLADTHVWEPWVPFRASRHRELNAGNHPSTGRQIREGRQVPFAVVGHVSAVRWPFGSREPVTELGVPEF
jgi:hypothetical protein